MLHTVKYGSCLDQISAFKGWHQVNPDETPARLKMKARYGGLPYSQPWEAWSIPLWPLDDSTACIYFDAIMDEENEGELWRSVDVTLQGVRDDHGQLACRIDADRTKATERCFFYWDLPDKEAVRDRLLKEPRELLNELRLVMDSLRSASAASVLERALRAPGTLSASIAMVMLPCPSFNAAKSTSLVRFSTSDADRSQGSTSELPVGNRLRVVSTIYEEGLFKMDIDGTFSVGWSNESGATFNITQPHDLRPLLRAIFASLDPAKSLRSIASNFFDRISFQEARPVLEENLRTFIEGQDDVKLDSDKMSAFFCKLALDYRDHFSTKSNSRALVVGFNTFRVLLKPRKGDEVIYIKVTHDHLVYEATGPNGTQDEALTVAIDTEDDFACMNVPPLCDILTSIGKTIHLWHDEVEDDETLREGFEAIASGRAIRSLLYYPIAHLLAARTYSESLRVAEMWRGVQSQRYPHRIPPAVILTPGGDHALTFDTGRKGNDASEDGIRTVLYPSEEEAEKASNCLKDYLHDVRLGALDPHDIFCVWNLYDGPGGLLKLHHLESKAYEGGSSLQALLESFHLDDPR